MPVSDEVHERLRAAYQELEGRHEALLAMSGISLDDMDKRRRDLAIWAASEAARWLDPRGGSGPTNEFGLKLREMAGLLRSNWILAPSKREFNVVLDVLKGSYPYDTWEMTARKVQQELTQVRRPPSGAPADALLEIVEAVGALLDDVKAAGVLEALPGLARARIDYALVAARKYLVAMQDEQNARRE